MTDDQSTKGNPINSENIPTGGKPKRAYNTIKKAKNQTENKAGQQRKIKQSDLVKWTVFVSEETKSFCGKAIEKSGLTIMEWVDSRLQQAARDEVGTKSKPPAKVEDVTDFLKQFTEKMEATQSATTEATNAIIQQQGQQIAELTKAVQTAVNRPQPTIREMIFGRKKDD